MPHPATQQPEALTSEERQRLEAISGNRYDGEPNQRLVIWATQVRLAGSHLDLLLAGVLDLDRFRGQHPLFAIARPSGRARTGRRGAA